MRSLALCVALVSFAAPVSADEKVDTSKVRDLADSIGKAVLERDYAKVADLTYPKIIEEMGGKEKMIELTTKAMKTLKDQGITSTSTHRQARRPGDRRQDRVRRGPTAIMMSGPKIKIESESYLLGVSTDGGKTWKFADGAGLSASKFRDKIFLSLPAGLKLPEPKAPSITKE